MINHPTIMYIRKQTNEDDYRCVSWSNDGLVRCWDVANALNLIEPDEEDQNGNGNGKFFIPQFLPYTMSMVSQDTLVVAGDSVPPPMMGNDGNFMESAFAFCAPPGNIHVVSSF